MGGGRGLVREGKRREIGRELGRELGRKEREWLWLEVDSTEIFSVPKA